ncbi:hypothetical protein [Flagellimonas sp.]|uniref:hypothetical protein n=1 Tax=Flagellimonas sp. TaxID=2058762 RepID=UPI003B52C938
MKQTIHSNYSVPYMRIFVYTLLLIATLLSCVAKHKPVDKITYNFQFYNYENHQVDNKGVTDIENIIREFRNFPWEDQVEKMNLPDVKSNPTIGIKDHINDYDFGITAYPDNQGFGYMIYYSFKVKGVWNDSFREGYTVESVEEALKLFFERRHDELLKFLLENSKKEVGIPIF